MESGDAKKLKQLEDENRKLKHVVAKLTLANPSRPSQQRPESRYVIVAHLAGTRVKEI
jgi:hypothetical protein